MCIQTDAQPLIKFVSYNQNENSYLFLQARVNYGELLNTVLSSIISNILTYGAEPWLFWILKENYVFIQ